MSRYTHIILLLYILLFISACQATKNGATDEKEIYNYSEWTYSNITRKDGKILFFARSKTTSESGKDSFIFIDFSPPNCKASTFRVLIYMDKPFDKSLDRSGTIKGEIRIDDLAQIPINYFYFFEQGKTYIGFRTEEILLNENFVKQFINGQMIRLNFTAEKKSFNLRFSLRNAVSIARYAMENCKEEAVFQDSGAKQKPGNTASPINKPTAPNDDSIFFK